MAEKLSEYKKAVLPKDVLHSLRSYDGGSSMWRKWIVPVVAVVAVVAVVSDWVFADDMMKSLALDETIGSYEVEFDSMVICDSKIGTATDEFVEAIIACEESLKVRRISDIANRKVRYEMRRVKLKRVNLGAQLGPAAEYELDFTPKCPSNAQLAGVLAALKVFAEKQFVNAGPAQVVVTKAPHYPSTNYQVIVLMTGGKWEEYFKKAPKDAPAPAQP